MNPILEKVYQDRKGMYVHALEVEDTYHLTSVIDALFDEFARDYTTEDIIDFIQSMELYCLNEDREEAVYNFPIDEYINSLV